MKTALICLAASAVIIGVPAGALVSTGVVSMPSPAAAPATAPAWLPPPAHGPVGVPVLVSQDPWPIWKITVRLTDGSLDTSYYGNENDRYFPIGGQWIFGGSGRAWGDTATGTISASGPPGAP